MNIMVFHGISRHPSEEVTCETTKMAAMQVTGDRRPCAPYSGSRVRRFAAPRTTDSHADTRARRFSINLAGPFVDTSFPGSRHGMLCVDDYSRFEIVRFLKKDETTAAVGDILATHITRAGIKMDTFGTNGTGGLRGEFQYLLNKLCTERELTPPHTPQCNGIVQRALGPLRDKASPCSAASRKGNTAASGPKPCNITAT